MESRRNFPRFQKLPIEIRLMIWRECLPSRVVEIDCPGDRGRRYNCTLVWPYEQNWLPPVLTRDYLVCVEVVTIHTSRAAARESGLFGLLSDAPTQLVDATDTSTIAKFHELWASNLALDMTPADFFRDQEAFQARLTQWLKELSALWVYKDWHKAYLNKWRGVLDPEEIWLGPRIDEDGDLRDMLLPECLHRPSGPNGPWSFLDCGLFSPNLDHPFVQQALAAMPRFRPRVMFRYCPLDCHLQRRDDVGRPSIW
ncbi:hypothetical protein BDV59DRAFT_192931 [Aspergillus ambiguus]|uniref:2EXR domain-containing protein n=1 Tax=Aspergillus ambiguus TaxID=176160 RepID=UPI003CCE5386